MEWVAREVELFHNRALRKAAEAYGIDQVIDIGPGFPIVGSNALSANSYDIVASHHWNARTVYVDVAPEVIAHSRAIRSAMRFDDTWRDTATLAVHADGRDVAYVLHEAARLLDLSRPVCLVVRMLSEVLDHTARKLLYKYSRHLVAGSAIVVSFAESDLAREAEIWTDSVEGGLMTTRSCTTVSGWLTRAGLTLVPPGLTRVSDWLPDEGCHGGQTGGQWGGLALKMPSPA